MLLNVWSRSTVHGKSNSLFFLQYLAARVLFVESNRFVPKLLRSMWRGRTLIRMVGGAPSAVTIASAVREGRPWVFRSMARVSVGV
jgi:hypothetical protein